MNMKFLSFALFGGLAVARPPPLHRDCKNSDDAQTCILPDGKEGVFLCLPLPPPRHHPNHVGGIRGTIRGLFDHLIGPSPSPDRNGEVASVHHRHHQEGKERHHHRNGPHPPHGPHGPRLSDSVCVPVDGLLLEGYAFPIPPFPTRSNGPPPPPPTCGCCGDVCPQELSCGCSCDLIDFRTNSVQRDGGVWVTITPKGVEGEINRCVPAKAYADADRVHCVTTCPSEDEAELLGEDNEGRLEEKENRD